MAFIKRLSMLLDTHPAVTTFLAEEISHQKPNLKKNLLMLEVICKQFNSQAWPGTRQAALLQLSHT